MKIQVRAASLQDGVAVLTLLEEVGYYPEPISFAKTYRKTLADPHFLVRVAEEEGQIIGMATLSLRYQLGLGGLLACLDELAVATAAAALPVAAANASASAASGRWEVKRACLVILVFLQYVTERHPSSRTVITTSEPRYHQRNTQCCCSVSFCYVARK